jgi:branched-chain amino acid transport system ATP-binding protein
MVKDLSMDFGGVRALDQISLTFVEGEIVGMIGPNGSGKSTFINVISKIYEPTFGIIEFRQRDITKEPIYKIPRLGIARTFQNMRIFENLSVIDNVMLARHHSIPTTMLSLFVNPVRSRENERRAREKTTQFIEFVHLASKINDMARDLSYGEQKCLEIARAISLEPALLLLDEPTAGMNIKEAVEITDLLKKVREKGTTILIVEHNMKVIMEICDRIVVLDAGKQIMEGTPLEVQTTQKVIDVYLGRD